MSYETSYDTGFRPFTHDKHRGKWSHPTDFLFACIGHAVKFDSLLFLPLMAFRDLGLYGVIAYVVILALCVVPIIFMQSFLGQFSGTGFITVFRIAPLFKGIGYVSLGLNLVALGCYGIYSASVLFQLFYTLQPTIPWSCEGAEEWLQLIDNETTICARNESLAAHIQNIRVPSVEFFRSHLDPDAVHEDAQFSWLLLVCAFIVWIVVSLVSLRPVETIGRLLRYCCIMVVGILSLILIRCVFLPNALVGMSDFFVPDYIRHLDSWFTMPWIALTALGPGWGSILTMASFNRFKTNIYSYSWIFSLAHLGIMLEMTFISVLLWNFALQTQDVKDIALLNYYTFHHNEPMAVPTMLTMLELPHFWSVMFFTMLLLGSLHLLVAQLLSFLTSVFDEFEILRERKRDVSLGVVGALTLLSVYFSSNHGINFMEFLVKGSVLTQMLLNLLLILVVLWIYGRERFQRDVRFMTSRLYSTTMTNIVRFVAPLLLLLGLLLGLILAVEHTLTGRFTLLMCVIAAIVTLIPWCLIPGYCIFRILQTSGVIGQRFRRCVRPTDWYPADPLYKQRYEETFSNPDISHQLTLSTEE